MNQKLYLGIDCGTQGTKALVLDSVSGQVLGQGSAPHELISGANGRREQDTGQWLEAFIQATRQALHAAQVDGQAILGLSVFPASSTGWCCSTHRARFCARPNSGATPKAPPRTSDCWTTWAANRARSNASAW